MTLIIYAVADITWWICITKSFRRTKCSPKVTRQLSALSGYSVKFFCLDVTIHADVIEDILKIAFLLWGQVVALDKVLIDGECLLAVNAIDDIEFEEPDVMDWTEFTKINENETDS